MSVVGLGVVVAIGAVRALDLKVCLKPFACVWVKYVKGKVKVAYSDHRTINTRTEERKSRERLLSHISIYWSIC